MVSKHNVLTKIFGDPQARLLKGLRKKVVAVNALSEKYKKMSKKELKEQTEVLKKKLQKKGTTLDSLLPDAFALVRESSDRVLGMRHFDVQLIGGMALHEGNVAEMKTGEGKTLVATLPVYLNALEGKGVHVVTVNDYLAQRDASWMGGIYHFLGLETGVIINDASFIYDPNFDNEAHDDARMKHLRPSTRKEAYAADITYGTNNEFGFDYLRDNMVNEVDLLRQRDLNFAIVDEVDSILIDEARTPLIISAPAAENPDSYYQFAKIAAKLVPEDYIMDEKHRTVALSDEGTEKVQKMLGIKNLYSPDYVRSIYHMDQALRAQALFKRDKDYVVTADGEVIIVDEFTGRLMQGRRYNEGLHQAIEAKEGVAVLQESMTLATVSFQNYFRLYKKLSGMTGTAYTEAEEFQQIYSLDVIQIPSNRQIARLDRQDLIFKTEKAKLKAVAAAIAEYHAIGRPVLVGSASIAKNELIASWLDKSGVPYELLNAKNNEREAAIIEKAGQKGSITLATNIAGRGTDIKLGEGVVELGGLMVIGSERHESRRIDNQLRGRGGRQGDPGETQFYVSTEDDLMRIFQGERIASLMDRLGIDEDTPIQNKAVSKTLESAQKRVEGFNFDTRKNVVQYDNVINRHRRVVYTIRRKILEGDDIKPEMENLLVSKLRELTLLPAKNNKNFAENFETIFPLTENKLKVIGDEKNDKARFEVARREVDKLYKDKETELDAEVMRKVEREVYLQVLDTLWMQHLENMQHLREGIHWRSVGQRDPLVEYRSESQKLFDSLQATLRDEVLRAVMHVRKTDVISQTEEDYQTELTRLAANAVEKGVNEVTDGEMNRDQDFKVKKVSVAHVSNKKKNESRKKKKSERQNRKRRK
ncbi:preprotein translocase subunit SecA [Candidatus Saccharibacteria bacterium CG11_big_fil_rev_8_21_14_0_20_41_19]|nr:MAG: preprotein translocase subunit SecA [Candidatus Saccharibacteria bacterium CG2_30_41_52]PIQ70875.1 MAG: preprotein translocase subunit SecA [Candidatus Saccharibacteria bacterium CG11_big_fil_rev_8_21_14_0_20_41_19]PIZ61210.1 MAG: preprotein translocase subunit SecA [Candidatus Saccharibacteria bacterium CG_4_10_14_0_2_um_filter_41_11]PJE65798.1 MAG: preprotein translocase subunit SecA [Candidatus Saccharibacteria bacterium CG10_big_fil_rev_8_21_14_0_10_41_32]